MSSYAQRNPPPLPRTASPPGKGIDRIAIVGGGAAGFACAEMLRRKGFAGNVTIFSDDLSPPPDRPNLSKDYLAGKAPEDWIPLRPPEFYEGKRIALRLDTAVAAIDTARRQLALASGEAVGYDRLLLATGAEPVKLDIPGGDRPHVHRLRSVSDCRAIIADAEPSRPAVVIGASFIGLEVAASLRTRGLAVHVVAPEEKPMARILGPELGEFVQRLHEEHGVVFLLKTTVVEIGEKTVRLKDGATIDAELVVVGIGVRPRVALAQAAGLAVDNGVLVDEFLQSSVPGIFAAGDIARWPDPRLGERLRIEHWVVAERQGQLAARNMLGAREPCDLVPFFWAQQYDVPINYVGHATTWNRIAVEGSIPNRDCMVRYERGGRVLAGASIFRDKESLELELAMERERGCDALIASSPRRECSDRSRQGDRTAGDRANPIQAIAGRRERLQRRPCR